MKQKKIRKSTLITGALLVYVSVMAAYLLPRQVGGAEKYVTLAASYVIVIVLCLVLRKKEELQRKRREEEDANKRNS